MVKVALLIGISEYKLGLPILSSTVQDAQAMKEVLQHPEIGGFNDVKVLLNPNTQKLRIAIYDLFAERSPEDLVLFYFSGHGVKDQNRNLYLATPETCKSAKGLVVQPTAVAASYLQKQMTDSNSDYEVIILDCCYSGAIAKGLTAKDEGTVDIEAELGGKGRAIFTSSTSVQSSFEQQGGLSIYTQYLVEGIKTGAADLDSDGRISADELHRYARDKVQEAYPAMNPQFYPVQEGYRIHLARSPQDDPALKYLKAVEEIAREDEGEIGFINRRSLNILCSKLVLDSKQAKQIEDEVLAPYRQHHEKLTEYEKVLNQAYEQYNPLRNRDRKAIKRLQKYLGLRDKDVEAIQQRIKNQHSSLEELDTKKLDKIPHDNLTLNSIQCPKCLTQNPKDNLNCLACGSPLIIEQIKSYHLPVGTVLTSQKTQYRIDKTIGEGGFGITYRGTELEYASPVAIYEHWPEKATRQGTQILWPSSISTRSRNEQVKRVFQEAKYTYQCSHPSIVKVYEWFQANNTVYIVMEFLPGKSLYDLLREEGPLPESRVKKYFLEIAQALKVIHSNNLLHRDIKPDNIIITPKDRAVLIDFGNARKFTPNKTQRMTQILTPGYAPIEQYGRTGRKGPTLDIYALCASMYELLTGQLPISAPDRLHNDPLVSPRQIVPSISVEMERTILTGMKMTMDERFQSVNELIKSLSCKGLCPTCGFDENPADSEFCEACGSELGTTAMASAPVQSPIPNSKITCPTCGFDENPADSEFCDACGGELGTA
ncbi:MAG: caspase family protein [Xenococcus sp. MO_188.B8]|nr:caspase family protein [Xenococcus sp. MO_188.B8]